MKLKVKRINLTTGGPLVAVLNKKDAEKLDLFALDRIRVKCCRKETNVILDISNGGGEIKPGEIGLLEETYNILNAKNKKIADISPSESPRSIDAIRKKIDGNELNKEEVTSIIKDLMSNSLSDIEVTYFVSGCYEKGLTDREIVYLIEATVNQGHQLKLRRRILADKHCIGGVPNNRTTMIITPIIAAAGLTIAKTSSRAITSPAGTADTMEALCKVNFKVNEIMNIVKKTNACIVWNGTMEITGADSRLIKVRHPLRLDPEGLLIASILSKKIASGATHLLIDIPIGKEAKVKTKKEAKRLKKKFSKIAKKFGIKTKVIITNGSQPIGNGIGPNLEAIDILKILTRNPTAPKDLEEKSIKMADQIFKLTKTKASAKQILNSGLAYKKMQEIIKAQKGKVFSPYKIKLGDYKWDYITKKSGRITEISNTRLSRLARIAGAPQNKGAGIYLHKKLNEKVKKGDVIATIYAENKDKLSFAKNATKGIIKIK